MGFFDLNIPYEASQSSKTVRIKLVVKAMELGYSGVAYNREMKGVMSDHDRCSIPLLSLSSLLNVAPSLAASVNLHRHLLGVPCASPFRQYTRLTVSVETPAQCQVLNSGNPILKTYDLVAARPLNQTTFDHACEKAEVHIIAIDFSEKLPFRLRRPMVTAAVKRGVYFEITYSDLIMDVHLRRQMISNAKLLVDWTRGKNIIFSSAAPSVNELRGPCDVTNLSSLLGLSMEQAKAAISKNCGNIITNALRKKNFYKEAIRVELISPDKKSDSIGSLFADWPKWDPLSSGEGDLQLDDIAKSLSDTTRASKSVKAIDFNLFTDSMLFNGGRFMAATEAIGASVATIKNSEKPGDLDLLAETDGNSLYNAASEDQISGYKSSQQLHLPTDTTKAYTDSEDIRTFTDMTGEEMKNLNSSDVIFPHVTVERHDLQSEEHIPSSSLDAMLPDENVAFERSTVDSDLIASCASGGTLLEKLNVLVHPTEKSMSPQGSGDVLGSQNVTTDEHTTEVGMKDREEISASQNVLGIEQVSESVDQTNTLVDHNSLAVPINDIKVEDTNASHGPLVDHTNTLVDHTSVEHTNTLVDHNSLAVPFNDIKVEDTNANHVPLLVTSNDMKVEDFQSAASHETSEEVTVGKQEHTCTETETNMVLDDDLTIKNNTLTGNCSPPEKPTVTEHEQKEADSEGHRLRLASSPSAKKKAKQMTYGKPLLFPLKRLLNPLPYKKKAKKFRRKLK